METNISKIENNDYKAARKKLLSVLIQIVVSAVILYFIISLVHWDNVLTAYKAADGRFILIGGFLLFLNIGIRTYKWHLMLRSVKNNPTYLEAFGSLMLGISLGSFTPGEIGEYAGRALHISNAKRSHLVGLSLLDKYQIFVVTSAVGLICLFSLILYNTFLIFALSICVAIFSLFLIFRMKILVSYGHRLNASLFKRSLITRVLDGFTLLTRKQVSITLLLTIIFHAVVVVQMFCLINAFCEITILHAFIGTSVMMFVKSLLPISLGDLGIREASSIFFFSMYNIPDAVSLNASLLLFVINILIPSIVGTYFLKHQQFSTSMFKQLLKKDDSRTK